MAFRTYKYRFMKPDDDGGGGGSEDRGDSLDAPKAPVVVDLAQADKDAAALAAELAAKEKPAVEAADADADADADKGKDPKKDSRIPLARHKEILDRQRADNEALQARLNQYEKTEKVTDTNKEIADRETRVEALESEYATLLADGKVKEAAAKNKELRTIEREISDIKSDIKTNAALERATAQNRYDVTLTRIEAAYPELNEDAPEYDAAVAGRVMKMYRSNMRDSMAPAAALQDAVTFVLDGPKTAKQKAATEVTPRGDKSAEEIAAERKAEEARKIAAAIRKTPASLKDAGQDSDKAGGGQLDGAQVMKLSQKEFNKLNDADLARLRGDEL